MDALEATGWALVGSGFGLALFVVINTIVGWFV